MAKFNAGDDVRRGDMYYVDPFKVIVKESLRGRFTPPSDEAIILMAMSMADEKQIQPVECRLVGTGSEKELQLTLGFTRTNAARLIRTGFIGTDGEFRQNENFMLQVKVVDCNDEDALRSNIIENSRRNEVSDIDHAHNQNRLRENYGRTDVEIAKLYQYPDTQKIVRLRNLLQLTHEEQLLVHNGRLATTAAIKLLELSAEDRKKLIDELLAEAGDGKINGSLIADKVRNKILADAESKKKKSDGDTAESTDDEVVAKKSSPRSMKNIRTFFESVKSGEKTDPAVKKFSTEILNWLNGRVSDKAMENSLNRLLNATATPVEVTEVADAA